VKILCILTRFNKDGYTYNPNSTEKVTNYLLPLGLAYISATLKQAGKHVTVLNLNNHSGTVEKNIRNFMTAVDYDVVFIGGLSLYFPHIRDMIAYIRNYSPRSKIVVGGGIMTAQPEVMFELLEPDFGIVGEGEETAVELINHLEDPKNFKNFDNGNINGIKGLVFRAWRMPEAKEKICINAPRQPIMDLDALPFPEYDSFGYAECLDTMKATDLIAYDVVDKPRVYPVLASRSCPFSCTFCFHPLGQKYRQRSVDNIMEEIKQNVLKYNINIVFIYDELFSNNKERMMDFCAKFKAFSDTLPYKLWFNCNNRVDTTTDEMLKMMRESGAYLLSFGLESYSQTVLTSMHKHTTPEEIDKIVHLVRENRLGLQGSFIFGDQAETKETAIETLKYMKKNRKIIGAGVSAGFIILFQGTPLYKQYLKMMNVTDETEFIRVRENTATKFLKPVNITTMTDEDFDELQDQVLGIELINDIYAVPKRRWKKDGDIYTEIKCPSCGERFVIKNIPPPPFGKFINMGCRKCLFRFYLASPWYPVKRFIMNAVGIKLCRKIFEFKRML
jgi:anaerobic magnesium-protoporphyrin IX monomethyl ester cyclase